MTNLRLGDSGAAVIALQRRLNSASGIEELAVDGVFGPATDRSVRTFQSTHCFPDRRQLVVDGVVGPATLAALEDPVASFAVPTVGHVIARIALREAQRGVVEAPVNTGTDVMRYQAATGLSGTGWPWCAAFVTWCYESAGVVLRSDWGFASVPDLEAWARKHGYWQPRDANRVPSVGALVVFTFSHVGIVIASSGTVDVTVEGNTQPDDSGSQRDGGGVHRRRRSHVLVKGYVELPALAAVPPR